MGLNGICLIAQPGHTNCHGDEDYALDHVLQTAVQTQHDHAVGQRHAAQHAEEDVEDLGILAAFQRHTTQDHTDHNVEMEHGAGAAADSACPDGRQQSNHTCGDTGDEESGELHTLDIDAALDRCHGTRAEGLAVTAILGETVGTK